jgi:hypothetical protein
LSSSFYHTLTKSHDPPEAQKSSKNNTLGIKTLGFAVFRAAAVLDAEDVASVGDSLRRVGSDGQSDQHSGGEGLSEFHGKWEGGGRKRGGKMVVLLLEKAGGCVVFYTHLRLCRVLILLYFEVPKALPSAAMKKSELTVVIPSYVTRRGKDGKDRMDQRTSKTKNTSL